MRVYTHPDCLGHQPGEGHPESPARLAAVTGALRDAFPALDWREAPLAAVEGCCPPLASPCAWTRTR